MAQVMAHQDKAVNSGSYPIYRYNPMLTLEGKNPLKLDYKQPKIKSVDYMYGQTRFNMLTKSNPEEAKKLLELAQQQADSKWHYLEQMANLSYTTQPETN